MPLAHSRPALMATLIESVLRAGRHQLAGASEAVVSKKSRIDLVTDVDVTIEQEFRAMVARRFPRHRVLAEELQNEDPSSRIGHCWIFDPIDGTTNYAHGLPFFCASLALEVDGRTDMAAVFDPSRQELFTAQRGGGAFLNGRRLSVTRTAALEDSVLCTGFPYDVHETAEEIVGLFGCFVARAQAVRRLGSAALDLCYVAAGRLDGFWERRLNSWDIAAGALIVEEAGGRTSLCDGRPFVSRDGEIVASNGPLHAAMVSTIRDWQNDRSGKRTV